MNVRIEYRHLDMDEVTERLTEQLNEHGRDWMMSRLQNLQIVVYVMVGGGLLGLSAVEQPDGFYVDDRCSKRPYSMRNITQAVAVLRMHAKVLGLTSLPRMPDFHNCGVF